MNETTVALLGASVGAVAALAGQAISPLIQSRRAHEQWKRDKRAEVCEAFFKVLREAEDLLDRDKARWSEASRLAGTLVASLDVMNRLVDASAILDLYSTKKVSTAAQHVTVFYMACINEVARGDTGLPEYLDRFHEASTRVRDAIRSELKLD